MASTSETGHAKNVATLGVLISNIVSYGEAYNPSKPSLTLTALKKLEADANNAVNAVNVAFPVFNLASDAREVAFAPLSPLATRVLNSLKATATSEQVDNGATAIVRKIKGEGAPSSKSDKQKAALAATGTVIPTVSTSQMSFDSRLGNLDKLIQFLATVPEYKPNEVELKVETLTTLSNHLKTDNTAVVNASVALSNARIARNEILYKPLTGLVDVALDAKMYIKSVFGASSPQYKQVSKLAFKSIKP